MFLSSRLKNNRTTRLWAVATMCVALLALANLRARSQEAPASRPAQSEDADPAQYLRTVDDVNRLGKLRRSVIIAATEALDARADNPTAANWREARRSIEVLRIMRPGDAAPLKALCRNITLNTNVAEMIPLQGYIAAQALAEIGGEGVAEALFASMRPTVDREGLLLRAFILQKMDSPEIALLRVQLEIKSAEARSPDHDVLRDVYLKNLRQLEALLSDPKLGEYKNWPANHRPPVPGRPPRVSN